MAITVNLYYTAPMAAPGALPKRWFPAALSPASGPKPATSATNTFLPMDDPETVLLSTAGPTSRPSTPTMPPP